MLIPTLLTLACTEGECRKDWDLTGEERAALHFLNFQVHHHSYVPLRLHFAEGHYWLWLTTTTTTSQFPEQCTAESRQQTNLAGAEHCTATQHSTG